jgi:hypothetical protein
LVPEFAQPGHKLLNKRLFLRFQTAFLVGDPTFDLGHNSKGVGCFPDGFWPLEPDPGLT